MGESKTGTVILVKSVSLSHILCHIILYKAIIWLKPFQSPVISFIEQFYHADQ